MERAPEIKFRNTVATINGDASVAGADSKLMETSEYVTSATDTHLVFSSSAFCFSFLCAMNARKFHVQIGEEISRALIQFSSVISIY